MLKPIASWRNVWFALTGCILIFGAGKVFAEWWGANAPPCSNGHCAPVTPWGYTPPHWHRWPTAIYPDMIKPASAVAPSGEEGATPSVEIPPPSKEAELQTEPPTRAGLPSAESTEPNQSGDMISPLTPPQKSEEAKPNDMPPLREVPGAQPPTIDPFAPPSKSESATPPPGRSSAIPKMRIPAGVLPSKNFVPEKMDLRAQRWTSSESKDIDATPPARVRIANDPFNRPIVPDQEPELLIPSLSTHPLASSRAEVRSLHSTGNPLRSDWGASNAQMASFVEPEPALVDDNRVTPSVSGATSSSTAKSNPLRR